MLLDYFSARTAEAADGCLVWQLYTDRNGYGRLTWEGMPGQLAHRVSYTVHVGPIPDELTVDHMCFNPPCVNPEHLRLLTDVENSRNQRPAFKTHCAAGHPFNTENTYIRTERSIGRRSCRKCNAEAAARYRSRRRAA